MGLILDAECGACGYRRADLRLGASHEEIAAHDVSTREVFAARCCGELQSVRVFMGQPYPETACDGCGRPLALTPEARYRIATLKGQALAGHPCPACHEPALTFHETGRFR